jgi:hypothetical protein
MKVYSNCKNKKAKKYPYHKMGHKCPMMHMNPDMMDPDMLNPMMMDTSMMNPTMMCPMMMCPMMMNPMMGMCPMSEMSDYMEEEEED